MFPSVAYQSMGQGLAIGLNSYWIAVVYWHFVLDARVPASPGRQECDILFCRLAMNLK
jgi:hypothetical protein